VVTNCSVRLGRAAAARLQVPWDVVITAEEAGFYKPDPRPHRLALERLGIAPGEAAFVAGSGYDLIGTAAVGLRTYWHNRVGLSRPDGAPHADHESRNLDDLVLWLEGLR
jgi:FMN phosphatase YigB (HAD superfamily)